jgi:hypothetical protein
MVLRFVYVYVIVQTRSLEGANKNVDIYNLMHSASFLNDLYKVTGYAQRQKIKKKSNNGKIYLDPTQVAKIGHGYLFMKEMNKH